MASLTEKDAPRAEMMRQCPMHIRRSLRLQDLNVFPCVDGTMHFWHVGQSLFWIFFFGNVYAYICKLRQLQVKSKPFRN